MNIKDVRIICAAITTDFKSIVILRPMKDFLHHDVCVTKDFLQRFKSLFACFDRDVKNLSSDVKKTIDLKSVVPCR